ncbi:NUDIX domain-containing protein [Patescibacteria group bacterium]|nr:NUDIX domain-containing protein [Patescibacteria group bacterium]
MKRIATIIIRNSRKQFFVHQRVSTKNTFPNLFGLGAGGHIEEYETNQEGAIRELFEETGLYIKPTFLFEFFYESGKETYPISVFEIVTDEPITATANEWQWSGWLSQKDVDKLSKDKKLCPDTNIFYQKYCSDYM